MLFQFNITLNEEDYLAYNRFHTLESKNGKKLIRRNRIFFACFIAIMIGIVLLFCGLTTYAFVWSSILGLFGVLYILGFKKILERSIKKQIKQLKKTGKLPFDPTSTIELYEDKLVEISESKRIEQGYTTLERICIVKNDYILLYHTSIGAYILPTPQIKAQADIEALLSFLSQKCNCIEYYEKA